MKNLKHIYRLRISDFELQIFEICKKNKIKPTNFVREAIVQKAETDFNFKLIIPF